MSSITVTLPDGSQREAAPGTPVREFAAQALVMFAEPGLRPALEQALNDRKSGVRIYAIQALSMLGRLERTERHERMLTSAFLVEGPTWAPNGRVLMYYRQTPQDRQGRGGVARLYSIDITGHNEREVVTPNDASDPAWSPLIP